MISDRANKLHFSSIVVDAHCDSITRTMDHQEDLSNETFNGHLDLPRMKMGNVSCQFFSCLVHPKYINEHRVIRRTLGMIDAVKALCLRNPETISLALSASHVRELIASGRKAAVIKLEGGHCIQDDLAVLRQYFDLGVRAMTLAWDNSNNLVDGIMDDPINGGLTLFGKNVIQEMNSMGMLVDVSHLSEEAFWAAMAVNNKPVIASHSAVWDICEHPRNLKDDQIKSIGNSGGVICVNFASDLISEKFRQHVALLKEDEFGALDEIAQIYSDDHEAMEGALEELESKTGQLSNDPSLIPSHVAIVDHIEYIIDILGPAHVGIGSSFDGTVYLPSGLEDCSKLPLITEELIKRGHPDNVIAGILGENMLRVMADVIGS